MGLADFLAQLDQLAQQAHAALAAVDDSAALEEARIDFLGAKNGRLKSAQKGLAAVDKADKPVAGQRFNAAKQAIESALEDAKQRLAQSSAASGGAAAVDITLPGAKRRLGHVHPITQTIAGLKSIMGRLGFRAVEGPEVEDERHNFEALNIPPEHPARDPLENFYLATASASRPDEKHSPQKAMLLRSQTSTVQIRVMESTPPPVRIISLGRVYRPDTADATHYPMFHQIEGLLVDRGVTMAHLKTVLRMFASAYLGSDVHIRFRPSFFPFTEPSVETDMSWKDGWMEFGGAGMVDPHVLDAVGYDPSEWTGFAFGLGVERLCMRRHGIDDIREFYKNDVRFLEQF